MLNTIIELAKKAGAATLEFYTEDMDVTSKKDDSPLTKADLASHHVIVDGLRKLTPDIPIISEESGVPDYNTRKEWSKFWMVDPLDGTKEFIKRNDEFTVNIALIEDGIPTLGVVYAPALELLYYGKKRLGTFKQEKGREQIQLNNQPFQRPGKARIVVSRSHGDDTTSKKLASIGIDVIEEVPSGSSIKFCLVAEGKADIYPRLGPTMEWDTAAADAVYRYSIKDGEKSSPLVYNKENLLNPYFILGLEENIDAESL